ncbi:MAG TPA: alpha/beta fold hydrolase [Rhodoblastus sp.]|nr:alpha/beta fold hydrolase [Rhodoblastus sp.]
MSLEILRRLPETATGKPPLLFVHGAWLGAWCWEENFLPFFASRGYPAYAVSLRGHSGSGGSLAGASMADYVADLREAAARLPSTPVLIGHSMGGGVVQKYLETHEAPAAILLGSMPPHGMSAIFLDAFRREPLRWLQANLTMNTQSMFDSVETCRAFFFSSGTPDADIAHFMTRANGESHRALFDMSLLNWLHPTKVHTPLLILGGEKDVVISPNDVRETARRHGATARILPGLPHAMMLDVLWREAAQAIADWLDARH